MSIDKFHHCLVAKCELHKQNVKCQIHMSTFKELLEKLENNALVPCTAIILIPNFSKKKEIDKYVNYRKLSNLFL